MALYNYTDKTNNIENFYAYFYESERSYSDLINILHFHF